MVIKIVKGHVFPVDTLKNTCTYTLKHATCQRKKHSSAVTHTHTPPLGTLGPYKIEKSAWSAKQGV